MSDTTSSADNNLQQNKYPHMTLEEFCGNIRRMESQGQDGISLFNDVVTRAMPPT